MSRVALVFPLFFLSCTAAEAGPSATAGTRDRPNVILVMTDDQGYGDIRAHGNSMIETPNLDRLRAESVRLTDFHVDPTCSPTRSALLTGRYSTRTGVWHTIMGRSLMEGGEVTIAEDLSAAGYRTAMFGKWHLGDNYPCRPQDQGFDQAFYHGGGGVMQTPDAFGNNYFDDTYYRATKGRAARPEKVHGYCTDVWFDNALAFLDEAAAGEQPFFVYLATNAPHGPYLVDEKYSKPYVDKGVAERMARFYGMIANIDENMGRLTAKLRELDLEENTILVFMTDNGTAEGLLRWRDAKASWRGFNAGMRGMKGSEYDGGHRVPFFVRWPAGAIGGAAARDESYLCAHVDVRPTLAELCGVAPSGSPALDGISLAGLLRDPSVRPGERTLFVHSQRVEHPRKWRKSAVLTERWRLVRGEELYDMQADAGQRRNVAAEHPSVVAELREAYEGWWRSLSPVFDDHVEIVLGNDAENPVHLTCHDWHTDGKAVPWHQDHIKRGTMANGFWAVRVERAGDYRITLRRWPRELARPLEATSARLSVGDVDQRKTVGAGETAVIFEVGLRAGSARLQTWLSTRSDATRGAYFVEVKRVGG